MGDRCYLFVECAHADADALRRALEAELGEPSIDEPSHRHQYLHRFEFEGVNYSGQSELDSVATSTGILFFASHDAGAEYGPGLFLSMDCELFQADCLEGESPAIELDPKTGLPFPGQFEHARAFTEKMRAFHEYAERLHQRAKGAASLDTSQDWPRMRLDGLTVGLRRTDAGRLRVFIDSEDVDASDTCGAHGCPAFELGINDATYLSTCEGFEQEGTGCSA